MKKNENKKE